MNRLINPVYGKEIRLRVRSIKFALTLLFYNLCLIGVALFGFEILFNSELNAYIDYSAAAGIYTVLICMEAVMVMFLVPAFTAGSIAGEREKQTLEILLTTILKPRQVVVGKLMSSISMILLLILSSLPVISIVFTVGGVSVESLIEYLFVILIFSIYAGSMGMFASAFIKRTVPATVFTYAQILISGIGTGVVVVVVYALSRLYYETTLNGTGPEPDVSIVLLILLLNPGITMLELVVKQYSSESLMRSLMIGFNGKGNGWDFVVKHWIGISMIVQLAMAVLLLFLAARCLNPLRKRKKKRKEPAKVAENAA